jgi:uncharacterized repeat protein (TIGR01451 family)
VNGEMKSKETLKMSQQKTIARSFSLRRAALIAALAALGAWAALPTAASAAGAPAWKLTIASNPTNFAPGSKGLLFFPQYTLVATNVGSAPTGGLASLTDTLPDGVTPIEATAIVRGASSSFSLCEVSGQTVTCSEIGTVEPGRFAIVSIYVEVDAGAPPSVLNEASISGGGANEAVARATTTIDPTAVAPFDFISDSAGLSLAATGTNGAPVTQAGSHPAQVTIDTGFPTDLVKVAGGFDVATAAGHPHDVDVNLPRGMIVNPTATPVLCTEVQLESVGCPAASAVGMVKVETVVGNIFTAVSPLFNMVPPPGTAAELGFEALNLGIYTHIKGGVNTAGEYELSASATDILALELNPLLSVQTMLWADPSDPSHDGVRGYCASGFPPCTVERFDTPLLTMPSSCRPSLTLSASADSWEDPTHKVSRSVLAEDSLGNPTGTDGCNQLEFDPTIEAKPTTNLADAPTGLDFKLHIPQNETIEGLAEAHLKDAKVTLPAGVSVNPSGADGLGACSPAQFGLTSAVGQFPVHTNETPAQCPDNAKIGSLEVNTQLLDHPVPGAIYAAQPYQNPFGSLLAIYLAIDDKATSTVIKLAGKVEADPVTGQLTATFKDNPELPFEDFKLNFFGGPRAALKTPLACGTHTTTSNFTPWSTPEGADATPSDSFQTSVAAAGSGACPTSEATAPNKVSFDAGTLAPAAGAYSPFVLKLSREDGTQRLTGIDTTLPKGLLAKLAGTTYCSEAQIAQAKSREAPNQGAAEQQSPSCPPSSEVGSVSVGAGAGITPYYASGHAYLAGPYKGAPLSLVVITPAVAGPYDLGAVVVRNALYVNSETAQVHAVSDPLPSILQGIPLDIRSIALKMDRPDFTLNPTSCDPTSVTGFAAMATGQSAALTSPFQVGGCSSLGFKPKLAITLKGGTKRTKHPALKAVVTYPKGAYANVASAQVTLPHSAFLDTTHIKTICTRVQFAADTCPAASIYGFAKATTPLLDNPVEGPVYLRSSSHKLPDLVLALDGQIDADAVARVDTGKGDGIRTTFEAIPDVPLSKVVLEMKGGKKGLLVNSENICKKPQKAIADFTAQNGKVYDTTPTIANSCSKKAKHKHKKHKATKHHKAKR